MNALKSGCIFYESAAASARKLTVSGKPSVKSDPHLYAELLTGKMKFSDASVTACDGLENDCRLSLLSFHRRLPTWMRRALVSGPGTRAMISFRRRAEVVAAAAVLGLFSCKTIDLFG